MVVATNLPGDGVRGFTLIELMLALALGAILFLVAAPLTSGWISGMRQMQARGSVVDAVGKAKSIALRNASGKASDSTAARIQLAGGVLSVIDAAGGTVWSSEVPESVALKTPDGSPFECTAYNSRGVQREDSALSCTQTASRLIVGVANRGDVDVDLL